MRNKKTAVKQKLYAEEVDKEVRNVCENYLRIPKKKVANTNTEDLIAVLLLRVDLLEPFSRVSVNELALRTPLIDQIEADYFKYTSDGKEWMRDIVLQNPKPKFDKIHLHLNLIILEELVNFALRGYLGVRIGQVRQWFLGYKLRYLKEMHTVLAKFAKTFRPYPN